MITFELSEADFRANESEKTANVQISKNQDLRLANPVTFRITPLTVQQALDREIIDSYPIPDNENVSPSRAGMCVCSSLACYKLTEFFLLCRYS